MTREIEKLIPEKLIHEELIHDDVLAVAQYRSVSGAAVFAALLGMASLLAFFSKLLLVVPLMGTLVALLALFRITRSDGALTGRAVALLGLVLSVVIGVGLVTHDATMTRLLAAQGGPWVVEWCELVRAGKLEAAIELTRPPFRRRPIDKSLAQYYSTDEMAKKAMEVFRHNPVIQMLTESKKEAHVEPGQALYWEQDSHGHFHLVQLFTLHPPKGGGAAKSQVFHVEMQRSDPDAKIPGVWHIKNYELVH